MGDTGVRGGGRGGGGCPVDGTIAEGLKISHRVAHLAYSTACAIHHTLLRFSASRYALFDNICALVNVYFDFFFFFF